MLSTQATTWHEAPRRAVLFGVAILAAVVVLVAKLWLVGPFVAYRPIGVALALGGFVALLLAAARALRLGAGEAALVGLPALAVVFVGVVLTPMTYEMEAFAERLPVPEGGVLVESYSLRPFRANHPEAIVRFEYAERDDLAQLTRDAVEGFRADGWALRSTTLPGDTVAGRVVDYGYFYGDKWGYRASCTLVAREPLSMSCSLVV